ncbi:uncharacterized protein LOC124358678 [Homalodisca vitripennis]|uniref:uncharacterized protein LOC124358678 n=1 Tax=Homalodisca vitripennis TaxID=197043 RepID=UPI001EEC3F40|nr:uncharacterized protein LOC124358678 [Homalodisca vitripennis]
MLVELPQAEKCCWAVSLRIGVAIIIGIRIILLLLVIIMQINLISLTDKRSTKEPLPQLLPEEWRWCYDLKHNRSSEMVLMTVTMVLMILWLILMIPAVLWEFSMMILLGALLEVFIWAWFFFISSYQLSLAILGIYTGLLFLYSVVCLLLECYILWIVWSYYVEVKELIWQAEHLGRTNTEDDTDSG